MVGGRTGARSLACAALTVPLVAGCQSQVPFYRSGERDGPVFGLGGPAPYVSLERAAEPAPDQSILSRGQPRPVAVYAATGSGMLDPAVQRFPARVYVPNYVSGTIDVIDQRTFRIVGRFRVSRRPQLVVPGWDLRRLWVNDSVSDGLVPIDPRTGRRGKALRIADPVDLYFTPDGRTALVMTGRHSRIDFRDPRSLAWRGTLKLPCEGVAHADFSADETALLASCATSGHVVKIDPAARTATGKVWLGTGSRPRDVRLSPDGTVFFVADSGRGGVWLIDATDTRRPGLRKVGFVKTGPGAYGLFTSRDARLLYVSNSGDDTVSVVDFATRQVVRRWRLPSGGTPELGGVSADGSVLWLSGRGKGVVYAISTGTGRLLRQIKVGRGPYGLCVYPQPGRYSLGHTGVLR